MKYSVVIPVYNRPDEVRELLESLAQQAYSDFEVIVVEDGSTVPCQAVVEAFEQRLQLRYLVKENEGPGPSRNYGARYAEGDYVIVLDSDCLVPAHYFEAIDQQLVKTDADAFGAPDRAHPDFSPIQKAISYSMTSFFTTGGIRGGKRRADKFYPRSYDMGVKRTVWNQLGGFADMRYGEDIDFSIRLFEAGYKVCLFPEAFVYHKRRTSFSQFYRQVHHSGEARIALWERHPKTLKLVHTLPSLFVVGCCVIVGLSLWKWWWILFLVAYGLLIMIDSWRQNGSGEVAWLSLKAAFVQLFGYGLGFLQALAKHCFKHQ